MYIVLAIFSAIFTGITNILSKLGLKEIKSNLATAIRTFVVLIFSLLIVVISGEFHGIYNIEKSSLLFLILSGLSTGLSWLSLFKALELGPVNQVTVVDKSSIIIILILSFIVLGDGFSLTKFIAILLIALGTFLMIDFKSKIEFDQRNKEYFWLVYAILGSFFAALTSILGKIGVKDIDSNLAAFIRTIVILIVSWGIVFYKREYIEIKGFSKKSILYLLISGIATGISWLFFYGALKLGKASVIVPIDKLSILVTIGFSTFFLKEKLSLKMIRGLILILFGTLLMVI